MTLQQICIIAAILVFLFVAFATATVSGVALLPIGLALFAAGHLA